MPEKLLVRYDDDDPRDHPYRVREGTERPGAFFYLYGHEGEGPRGWPGRERRVYAAPPRVGRISADQSFYRDPGALEDIIEIFVSGRSLHRLRDVPERDAPFHADNADVDDDDRTQREYNPSRASGMTRLLTAGILGLLGYGWWEDHRRTVPTNPTA